MLKCVAKAGKQKKRKKESIWEAAAGLYCDAFIKNAAEPEESRVLIRGPTTADEIKRVYEGMAARLRTDTREQAAAAEQQQGRQQQQQSAQEQQSAQQDEGAAQQEAAQQQESAQQQQSAQQQESAPPQEVKVKALDKNAKRVMSGAHIARGAVSTTGMKVLAEYLHAMGVVVKREQRHDVEYLREAMLHELQKRNVDSWSVQSDEVCQLYLAKRRKHE